MNLYIVYYQFVDDPSTVRGIYSTFEKAEAARKEWMKYGTYGMTPEIAVVVLDVEEDGDGLVLS